MSEQAKKQIPSVGRIVHYVAFGTPKGEFEALAHRAAIITEVREDSELTGLCILNPTGMHFKECPYSEDATVAGSWHWPEYVPAK